MSWTGDMATVADLCGDDVAAELCERLPGILLYVPMRLREKGPISRLEIDTAAVLVAELGGDTLYIPSARPTYQDTFASIEALVDQGLTVQQIALKLGVTEGWIYQCRRKAQAPRIANKTDPRQLRSPTCIQSAKSPMKSSPARAVM